MKPSALLIGVTLVSAAVSARGLWSFYRSFDGVPQSLQVIAGTASEVQVGNAHFAQAHASFTLRQPDGSAPRFSYRPLFAGFQAFASGLREGVPVEVTIGPEGNADFWGLKLGADVLMTPEQADDARRADGHWSLALGLGFLAVTLWNLRDLRRRDA